MPLRWDEWVPEQRLLKLNDNAYAIRRKLLEAQTKKSRAPPTPISNVSAVVSTATPAGASGGSGAGNTGTSTGKGKDKATGNGPAGSTAAGAAASGKKGEGSGVGKKRVRDTGLDTVSSPLPSHSATTPQSGMFSAVENECAFWCGEVSAVFG